MKKLNFIKRSNGSHWVGDGFPVQNIFSYDDIAQEMSPFLLMDYAGPHVFAPSPKKRGVGSHPHRGLETVTIVYSGEVDHRDSHGGGGHIGPDEVQWMTAASGLVHEEFHGEAFTKTGGMFEVVQLWVNLRKKDKMTRPRYQSLTKDTIPVVNLSDGAGIARIIAGSFNGANGPAQTFSPMHLWDMRLTAKKSVRIEVTNGYSTSLFVLKGGIKLTEGEKVSDAQLAVFEREGKELVFETLNDTVLLFMSGEPLNEPIVGQGPFVMNTEDEIRQAYLDYRAGKMGTLE